MSNLSESKTYGFLHHNKIFDVIITFFIGLLRNLIMMQKAHGIFVHLNWTKGRINLSCLGVLVISKFMTQLCYIVPVFFLAIRGHR